jgi:hypothetical protein
VGRGSKLPTPIRSPQRRELRTLVAKLSTSTKSREKYLNRPPQITKSDRIFSGSDYALLRRYPQTIDSAHIRQSRKRLLFSEQCRENEMSEKQHE